MPKSTVSTSEIKTKIVQVLLPDWRLREEQFGFLVTPPKNTTEIELPRKLSDEAWRLARAVSFKKFTSIEKTREGAYLIYSKDGADTWIQILLDKE
jgi:hypothetical protein